MTEFKLNQDFLSEVSALNAAGDTLNTGAAELSADGVNTLKTGVRYIQQHSEIIGLIKMYKELVLKDAADLLSMMDTVASEDEANAEKFIDEL